MKPIAAFALLATGLGCRAKSTVSAGASDPFGKIKPSTDLKWTPCYDDLHCAKLQVPLDHKNKTRGSTSIAFVKLTGKNATADSQSIVLIPGGPGGSGIDLLRDSAALLGVALGDQYNVVSFDPRGDGNSGPKLDCFSGNKKARAAFLELHSTGATDAGSLARQYYSSSIYGEWCNNAVETEYHDGYYVTTPAVAHDLLSFVKADAKAIGKPASKAKLWAYGVSYGTVVGTTFASLFPDRVGRMVLDGVLNAEQYYTNDWRDNLDQADEAIEGFATLCHAAGAKKCAFWGSSPKDILSRLNKIIVSLKNHPVPISGAKEGQTPVMATYSDLKKLLLDAIYAPGEKFPSTAQTLHEVEQGNVTGLIGVYDTVKITSDARLAIQCTDSYATNKLKSIRDFQDYVEFTMRESKYVGDIYPIYLETILCRSFKPQLPCSMSVKKPKIGASKGTSFPILFTSNTIDPISPVKSARFMSRQFPGSVVLQQEGIGHTIVQQMGSTCYFTHVQAYFQGVLPPKNTTCKQESVPFK